MPRATVERDDRIRLFVALEVPDDVVVELVRWGKRHLARGRPVESFHITLAFLGAQPRSAVAAIVAILSREAAATERFVLEPLRYRETRSVGMLVLADPSGRATSLAHRVQRGLEGLGVYERERRPWLPHVTVLRFRERPQARPAVAGDRTVRSVRGRCFAFTPAPVRGAVRGTRVMFARNRRLRR